MKDSVENKRLADKMASYLLFSRSDSTARKYHLVFMKRKQFICEKGHIDMPANPVHIALYLTYLLESGCSFHIVSGAKYAIKWAHNLRGFPDVTDHFFVDIIV